MLLYFQVPTGYEWSFFLFESAFRKTRRKYNQRKIFLPFIILYFMYACIYVKKKKKNKRQDLNEVKVMIT